MAQRIQSTDYNRQSMTLTLTSNVYFSISIPFRSIFYFFRFFYIEAFRAVTNFLSSSSFTHYVYVCSPSPLFVLLKNPQSTSVQFKQIYMRYLLYAYYERQMFGIRQAQIENFFFEKEVIVNRKLMDKIFPAVLCRHR